MYLETDRLLLRNFTMADLSALWEIFRDEEAMVHMAPMTYESTEEFLHTFCVEAAVPGAFALQRRRDAQLVGYVLFHGVDAPGIFELGWVLRRDCWRQGYALEISRALLRHAFGPLGAHKVVAQTEDPLRAVPLLEKLGMKQEGAFRRHSLGRDGQWHDLYWYGLLEKEFDLEICGT